MMRPFLKWAGGKFRIVQRINTLLPAGRRLVEPFVGSGAVFLNSDYPEYLLADINHDLIGLYRVLQETGTPFIDYCERFFSPDSNNAETYYECRQTFNETEDSVLKSALFVYLNRHGYNGLCRYNARGKFNVPFGRHRKPYFPRREMQYFYEKTRAAYFGSSDFETIMSRLEPGDVVYCDPPYVPLSLTANFTSYSTGDFNLDQQAKLARLAEVLAQKGIPVVISNHETPFTKREYAQATIISFAVQRNISCNGTKRNKANELLAVFAAQ